MKILLTQTATAFGEDIATVPYSQIVLAGQIEDIADVRITGYNSKGLLPSISEVLSEVKEFRPDVVGITIEYAVATSRSLELAEEIKKLDKNIKIIAGGHQATFAGEEILRTGYIDVIFIGEADFSLREYILKKDISEVKGLKYLDKGSIVFTGNADPVNLCETRPPAYHLLRTKGVYFLSAIESSRGCPYNCDYCETRNFFGSGLLRKLTPPLFVRNLKAAFEHGKAMNFFLTDDCFTANMKKHVKPVCEAIIAEGLSINLMIQARIDNLMQNIEMLPLMRKAGFKVIIFGIESIYQHTLAAMNKNADYDTGVIKDVITRCHDNDIKVFGSVVFGYPEETEEMIQNTVDFLKNSGLDIITTSIATPLPGSNLYKRAFENNEILSRNYDLYDYNHRIWKQVPESTVSAVGKARRSFYLRPEYIRKVYDGLLGGTQFNIINYMFGGILLTQINNANMSRPRSADEWIPVMEGFRQVLQNKQIRSNSFSGTVLVSIDKNIRFYLLVEKGIIVQVTDSLNSASVIEISMSMETALKTLVYCSIDIISGLILGKILLSSSDFETSLGFVEWFSEIQAHLNWFPQNQSELPSIRARFREWSGENQDRENILKERYNTDSKLFIWNEKHKGILVCFSSHNDIYNVSLLSSPPKDCNYSIVVDSRKFENFFSGGYDSFFSIITGKDLVQRAVEPMNALEVNDFFRNLESNFLREKAGNDQTLIQYTVINKDQPRYWYIKIDNGSIEVKPEKVTEKVNAAISIQEDGLFRLINGIETPMDLFSKGEMSIQGNPAEMLKMTQYFGNLRIKAFNPV